MSDYRVSLEAFEGPLDLLLYLIRRDEVDIHDIPVAAIADQFMRSLEEIERIDLETAGEFLVMAATLMELKSRMIGFDAARKTDPAAHASHTEDPRRELVRQLLEYKQFRDAADQLEDRLTVWEKRAPAARAGYDAARVREHLPAPDEIELEDLTLSDLVEAFGAIAESVNFERLGDHQVFDDDTPIELHAEDLVDRLSREGAPEGTPLGQIFEGRRRAEMIGLFLAMLELVRQRRLRVRQDEGNILVSLREQSPEDAEPEEQSTQAHD